MPQLTEKIIIDPAIQPVPYFIYTRLKVTHFREYFNYTIPAGYGYLLRRFVFQNAETFDSGFGNLHLIQPTRFEFFLNSYYKSRQVEPVPGRLFSSPGHFGDATFAPDPVDLNVWGVLLEAAPKKYEKILNWYYPHADTIRLDYTGVSSFMLEEITHYVDVCFQGYLVPEGITKLWRK